MIRRFWTVAALPIVVASLPALADLQKSASLGKGDPAPVGVSPIKPVNPGKPHVYTHAEFGYSVAVPPGADAIERQEAKQLSVRSRKGYVVNIQAGAKRSDVPLSRMSMLLEAKYLGPGKPWSLRGQDRAIRTGGLPAHDVIYEGAGSKARVVVARGAINDYVLIFIAPVREFRNLEPEFEWILDHFRPGADDLTRPASSRQAAAGSGGDPVRRFAEPGYGYAIEYPADWEVSKPANMATMFSGREGTPAYAAIVGVQNIAPPGARDAQESARRAMNQLRSSLGNAVRRLTILGDADWTYRRGDTNLSGRQLEATYVHGGQTFRKRIIVIPRPDGTVAHVWSYTAPNRQYAALQPYAERMLESWTILTNRQP